MPPPVASPDVTDPAAGGSEAAPTAAGEWFPDPLDRYDSRYHNGREWTADVAVDGRRFVDPLGIESGERRNGRARVALFLGVTGVAISWLPFLFAPGLVASLLAVWLGWSGLRRSRTSGVGRSNAVVGLSTGACGALAASGGLALTFLVLDILDDFENPNPHTVEITSCEVVGTRAMAEATITNEGTDDADFMVRIDFVRPGTDNTRTGQNVDLRTVAPGETRQFVAAGTVDLDDVECVLTEVTGPLPFRFEF
jgi:hypothetical protein